MSTDITPPEGGTPPAGDEPTGPDFSSWEPVFGSQAGELNPYEVRQAYDWVNSLKGDEHEQTLTRAMRDWQYLSPDEDWGYVQSLIEADRARKSDPFAQQQGAGGYQQAPDLGQYAQQLEPGDMDELNGGVDPYELRRVWQSDMEEYFSKQREEIDAERQMMQISHQLTMQLERVARDKGLDDQDRNELWNRVNARIQEGNVRPEQFENLVADTHDEYTRWVDALIARRMAAAQGGEPMPPVSTAPGTSGGTPAVPPKQVTSFKDLAKRTMDKVRAIEGDGDIVD